ncbi:MAG: DUF1761 domain-containing protein [Pseudomonadales bacterium]
MESEFNLVAVLAASVAAMFLGGLWYSPLLFEKRWRQLVDATDDQEAGNPVVIYGGAFTLLLLSAAVFHAFLGPNPDFAFAIGVGVAAGVAWAAGSLWISYLFEGRARGLYFINGGYHIVQYTVYGMVFGLT